MTHYVGVDIGGTFTDIVAVKADTGELSVLKTPSTPPTFIDGILGGLSDLPFPVSDIDLFIHGSTIATNGIIERKGAPTVLITTRGFRDVLLCARATRPDVYDIRWVPAEPLVKRRNILEVSERINYRGEVVTPLDVDELRALEPLIRKRGVTAVAIAFLNSFMNSAHEQQAKEILQEMFPDIHVSTSSAVFPEIREFERTSTVVANAYVAPLVDRYLEQLVGGMRARGFGSDLLVVHSGGGVMTDVAARRIPARTCYSGPAGGVMGGAYIGALAGYQDVITMDIGGTSTDVALVTGSRPVVRSGLALEHNVQVSFPTIDVTTVGAGGGSIGWIDQGGLLHNGPMSSGANPGPACYGKGGSAPTNTDAQLVLGRLDPAGLLDGTIPLYPDLAREVIQRKIADEFGWSVDETADAVLTVANANIVNAIRLISIQRGHDPRNFALVAFGGAGPLHAVEVARELGIPDVVIPQNPGLASAFGMLHVDVRHDLIRPIFRRESDLTADELNRTLDDLRDEATHLMAEEGALTSARGQMKVELTQFFDMKYFPQSSYLTLEWPGSHVSPEDIAALVEQFNARHEEEFGYRMPRHAAEVEVGHVRLVVRGVIEKPQLQPVQTSRAGSNGSQPAGRTRPVYFKGIGWQDAAVIRRVDLAPGDTVNGPAIVQQFDTTTVLPPASVGTVDTYGNLVIKA